MKPVLVAVVALCAPFVAACSSAHFQVDVPPSFHTAPPSISIVGVYRDGRFSSDTWPDLAPAVEGAVRGRCVLGHGEELRAADPALYDELEDDVRRDGVTDDVVGRFAPASLGDVLMVLHFYTPVAASTKGTSGSPAPALPAARAPYSRGSAGTMGRPLINGAEPLPDRDRPNVELAAVLYAKKDHAAIGEVVLTYDGRDTNAAIQAFGERLARELHGARCAGWTWPTPAAPKAPAPEPEPDAGAPIRADGGA